MTDAILVSIEVSPDNVTIPRTTTEQFTALGTFSDSATADLTTQVTWSSSDDTAVVISNAALSQGLATALAKGNDVTITATKGSVAGREGEGPREAGPDALACARRCADGARAGP